MANVRNQNSRTFQEFLIEAEDIVQTLSSNLGKIQTVYASSGEVNPDIVNTLFRGIHTLKGISAVSGFSRITALSHKFEDLLDCLRFGRIQLTSSVMDTLFEVTDVLLGLLKNINEQGEERIEIGYIVNKIDGILNDTVPPVNVSSEDLACIEPALLNRLSEHEIHRLYERLKKGWITYSITVSLQVDSIDEDVEMLQGNLTQFGEIITFIPISGFSADTGISFDIIFVSDEADVESRIYSILKANIISVKKIGSLAPVIESKKQQLSFLGIMPGRGSADHYVRGITKTVRVDIGRLESLLNIVGEALLLHGTVSGALQGLKARQGCNLSFLDINKGSRELYKKALEIDKELGDSKKIAMTLRGIGMLSLKQGHFQEAAIFYLRAYDVSSNAGDTEGALEALDSLSDAYQKSGDDKKAEEMMKKKVGLEKEKKK